MKVFWCSQKGAGEDLKIAHILETHEMNCLSLQDCMYNVDLLKNITENNEIKKKKITS